MSIASRLKVAALIAALAVVGGFAFWPHPVQVPISEATQHVLAFAVLAALWRAVDRRVQVAYVGLGLLALGGAIGALQWLFTPRRAEWRDLGADVVGAVAVLAGLPRLRANMRDAAVTPFAPALMVGWK